VLGHEDCPLPACSDYGGRRMERGCSLQGPRWWWGDRPFGHASYADYAVGGAQLVRAKLLTQRLWTG